MSENAAIHASQAGSSDFTGDYILRPDTDWVLTSNLFKLDPMLIQVALGIKTLNLTESSLREDDHRGPHVDKVKKALKIILGLDDDDWSIDMYQRFDLETHNRVLEFQMQHMDLNATGVLDAPTIRKLDASLTEIFFYDIETGTIIHDARTAIYVGAYTAVLADADLRERPLDGAAPISIGGAVETVPQGTAVFLIQLLQGGQWFWVETVGGIQGYLPLADVWTESIMPEPTARLVKIGPGPGNKIKDLILPHIQAQRPTVLETDLDEDQWKFYALATLRYNNPAGTGSQKYRRLNLASGLYDDEYTADAGIYLAHPGQWNPYQEIFGPPGQEKSLIETVTRKAHEFYKVHVQGWDSIDEVKLKGGASIWLPGIQHVEGLYQEYVAGERTTSAAIIEELKNSALQMFEGFRDQLAETWPVGWGLRLDAGLGATFGIPVSVDADYYFAVWRESETMIRMVRRGTLAAGLDVGAGAGWFVGSSNNKKGLYGEDNNYAGAMFAAGVQVQAGLQIMIHQEMEFPLDSNLAVAGFLAAALNAAPVMPGCIRMFFGLLQAAGIDPNDFTTKIKGEVANYRNLSGQAGISLGFGNAPTTTPSVNNNFWLNDNRKQSVRKGLAFSWYSLLSLFSFQFGINASDQTAFGIQIAHEDFEYDEVTAFRLPQKTSVEVYADSESRIGMTIPIVSMLIPDLPLSPFNFGIGFGVKIVADFFYNQADFDGNPATHTGYKFNRLALYTKSADADIYQGPASEIELGINVAVTLKSLHTAATQGFSAVFQNQSVGDFFQAVHIRKLAGLGSILTNPLFRTGISSGSFFSKDKSLNTLIAHTDPKSLNSFRDVRKALRYGLHLVALLDIEYRPPKAMLIDLISDVFSAVMSGAEFSLENLPKVLELLSPKTMPERLKQDICRIIENSEVPKAALHVEFGLVLGFGLYIADLAKLRLRVKQGINGVYHLDFTDKLDSAIQEAFGTDLKTFLKSFFITAPERNEQLVVEPRPKPGGP